ncbi:MAG TPA: hypothetical protein VFU41_09020 [Gemmatimonadales bacterium]|nr:hypothetical protein [Gemmatimonadales bacterium]
MKRFTTAVLIGVIPLAPLRAQEVAYEGGIGLATGKYFYTTRTTSWTISTGLAYSPGRLVLRAGLPVYVQNSSLVRGSGAGMMPSGGARGGGGGMGGGGMTGGGGAAQFRAAAGDPIVQAGWRPVGGARTGVTISAAAKLPVTDTTDYGTGEWDVGGILSLTRHVGATVFLGVDLSYWHLGDPPTLDFRDPVTATASASDVFAKVWGASVFVTGGTSALRGYEAPVSLGAIITRLGKGSLWGLTATVGFTETVPDFAIGASWRIGL